jgi:hypothetical protein
MMRLACVVVLLASIQASSAPRQAPPTFRSRAEGVAVHVSVRDRNAPVGGLSAEDFVLTDNGVGQTVRAVALETAALDVTLLLDASGSMAGEPIATMKKDVRTIAGMLRPEDRLRLVTFASRATEVLPMQHGTGLTSAFSIEASGTTAFFHGLIAALLQPSAPGRPHLIVAISDGADNLSLLDGTDVRDLARRSDAILHVVQRRNPRGSAALYLWGWLPYSSYSGIRDIRDAAESNGGRLLSEDVSRPLPEAFKRTIEDFRAGYVLWFTPAGVTGPGWHDLSVKVKGRRYDIRARRGYFGG